MLEAATAPQSQLPRLSAVGALLLMTGSEATKKAASPVLKAPSCPNFYSFQNLGNGICKFHNYTAISVSLEVGSHLGWHSTVCWPLRGGRGTQYTQKPLKI